MGVFGPIPLQSGFTSMGELADLIMKKRTEQERSRQFNEQHKIALSQEGRQQELQPFHIQQMKDVHSTSMLNNMINQKASQRAEAQLPYLIQQYQDTHKKAASEHEINSIRNRAIKQNYEDAWQAYNQGKQNASPQSQIPENDPGSFLSQGAPQQNAPMGQSNSMMQNAPAMGQQAQQAPGQDNVLNFEPSAPGFPNAQQAQQQMPQMQQQEQLPQAPEQQMGIASPQSQGGVGTVTEIAPADPVKAYKDVEGKPSISYKGKYQIATYPSGRTTATELPFDTSNKGMPLEDKFKLEEFKANLRKRNAEEAFNKRQENTEKTLNKKTSDKIELSAKPLSEAAGYIKSMHDIIKKNKNATGVSYRFDPVLQTFGGKDSAAFKANSANLASQAALIEKSNPGSQMVGFFDKNKPNVGAGYDFNIGMLLANAEKVQGLYDFDKNNWERMNPGKKYPMKDPDLHELISELSQDVHGQQNEGSEAGSQGGSQNTGRNWVWNVKENKWEP